MYMDDAIEATIKLMEADPVQLSIRTSYNIQAMVFTPTEIAASVRKLYPNFEMDYNPDTVRQHIADSWPQIFVDEKARKDWGWAPKYDLDGMVAEIFKHLTPDIIKSMRPPA